MPKFIRLLLLSSFSQLCVFSFAQNVGLGILAPLGKLHVKGAADVSQLIIDANSAQSNTSPLFKLRNSTGTDLMWIHSDHIENIFIGRNAGKFNNAVGGGTYNTFMGSGAGNTNTTGYQNTANGAYALYYNTTGYHNTGIGIYALLDNTTGYENTGLGTEALYSNTIGNHNTASGYDALYRNTKGSENTANGVNALFNNKTASQNIAIGKDALTTQSFENGGNTWISGNVAVGFSALFSNQPTATTNGINNTAIGNFALYANTTGYENTGLGVGALYSNTTGYFNTAVGRAALLYNTTGYHNVAAGLTALVSNTTASQNTAIGNNALYSQSYSNGGSPWASGNVAVGFDALYSNQPTAISNGINNTAVGALALRANTTGWDNTAIGVTALFSNTTGQENTAVGRQALFTNTTGAYNTAIGYKALRFNTSGVANVAIGNYALTSNTIGQSNTASGHGALYNTTGDSNTGSGYQSLYSNSVGWSNTTAGMWSLYYNTTGYGNCALGYSALNFTSGGFDNVGVGRFAGYGALGIDFTQCTFVGGSSYPTVARTNVAMLGYGIANAQCTDNNQVLLGNTAIGQIRAQVTGITAYSDARFKTNIQENVSGLDFILKLKPVTYNTKPTELHSIWGTPDSLVNKIDHSEVEKITQIGFLAQDVERAAIEIGFNFPGIDVPRNEKEVYSLRYVDFIMPIVKAVQELNRELNFEVANLKSAMESQKTENEKLTQRLEKIESLLAEKEQKF